MKRATILIGIMCVLILTIWCGSAMAETRGTYHGVDWVIDDDGVLTLGNGDIQTMTGSGGSKWYWYNVKSVVCSGTVVLDSGEDLFSTHRVLETADLSGFDTSHVTNMSHMFYACGYLTSLDLSSWDTSNVTDMSGMFTDCGKLTSLNLSGWDTSNVVYMGRQGSGIGMFQKCSKLTSLDVSELDTSNVTDMCSMFKECKSLTHLDVSGWNTSKVTSMHFMFDECESLTSLDVSGWDTGSVTDMYEMFHGCSALESLDVSGWDTSHVTEMYMMFVGCKNLVSLDASGWVLGEVRIGAMFMECQNLTSLDISGWDTTNVTEASSSLFYNCKKLREVTLGDRYKTEDPDKTIILPTPPASQSGVQYTRKWIREDRTYGPFTPSELIDNYGAGMGGKWVWEPVSVEYTLCFSSASYPDAVGEMAQVTTSATSDYQLVANQYALYGFVFDHWDDGRGHTYVNGGVIPANTYAAGDVVTLNLVMKRRDTSIQMHNGEFTFSILGDEKAVFIPIPAGTSYQVFEENLPDDWVLIAQADTTGLIIPLEEAEALFLNKYQPDMATIQFTGRKLMDGQPAKADSFSFELWEGNVLLQTKSVIDGGFVQFDILEYGRNDAGIHTYVIKELVGTDDSILYDGHEETIDVEVTTEVGDDNITRVRAEVMHSESTYPDILFENWTKPGALTLKKLVDDLLEGHEGDEFRFRITFKQENGLPLNDTLTCIIEP